MENNSEYEHVLKALSLRGVEHNKVKADSDTSHKYIDVGQIMKDNDYPHVLFVFSGRSSGKSYSASKYIVDECIKGKCQFILLTRSILDYYNYQDYFSHCTSETVPSMKEGQSIEFKNDAFYLLPQRTLLGQCIALSMQHHYKSAQFPKVRFILFEEITLQDPSKYLTRETECLGSLVSTVFRGRSEDTHLILMGNILNELSYENDFVRSFGIPLEEMEVGETWKNGDVVCFRGGMAMKPNSNWIMRLPHNESANTGDAQLDFTTVDEFMERTGVSLEGYYPVEYDFGHGNTFLIITMKDFGSTFLGTQTNDVITLIMNRDTTRLNDVEVLSTISPSEDMLRNITNGITVFEDKRAFLAWSKVTNKDVTQRKTHIEFKAYEEEKPRDKYWFLAPYSVGTDYPVPRDSACVPLDVEDVEAYLSACEDAFLNWDFNGRWDL